MLPQKVFRLVFETEIQNLVAGTRLEPCWLCWSYSVWKIYTGRPKVVSGGIIMNIEIAW